MNFVLEMEGKSYRRVQGDWLDSGFCVVLPRVAAQLTELLKQDTRSTADLFRYELEIGIPNDKAVPGILEFTANERAELCGAVGHVLASLPPEEIACVHLLDSRGLVVAYDGALRPFLGHTAGYNNSSKPPRLYLESTLALSLVGKLLQRKQEGIIPGGRVFIGDTTIWFDRGPLASVQRAGSSLEKWN